jgi:hypothetical protein
MAKPASVVIVIAAGWLAALLAAAQPARSVRRGSTASPRPAVSTR